MIIDFEITQTGKTKIAAFEAGRSAWRQLDIYTDILELPKNTYGDEYQNPIAQAFRCGFNAAARKDGYTYSRVTGEYCEGGEVETDDFPEFADIEESK
jgi:hypothetical protein